MLSQKSLRSKFILQLASASAMLILIFSTMLYHYIKINIYENVVQILNHQAIKISQMHPIGEEINDFCSEDLGHSIITASIIKNNQSLQKPKYLKTEVNDRTFLELQYPVGAEIIVLKTDTTFYDNIISQILVDIIIINVTMSLLIIFYAMFLSRTILLPIKILSKRLSKLDETVLTHIDETSIPSEFKPLSKGINRLVDRIHTFIEYQKELFIGIAHELKTPLAVMKTKNEVTLLKDREKEKYIEALQNNNKSIDNMNKMISSILEIGRQEDAQFEPAIKKDMIAYLKEICANFQILAKSKGQSIEVNFKPKELFMNIQPQLFLHILQNFLQNAMKFSKDNSIIYVKSEIKNNVFKISVIDEGVGIDENVDLFAPFKRYGNQGGAGLGLFLAKGAAQAMNATVYIKNRTDGKSGVVAIVELPIDLRVLKQKDPKKAKIFGLITMLCDALKGLLPIIIANFMGFNMQVLWTMAVLAVMGHCFSIFLKFEGGKGVATSFGIFLFFLPIEALIGIATWLFVGKFLKISSIASLSGIAVFVILSFIIHPEIYGINTHAPILVIAFIVFYKHIPNIIRLIQGKEDKVA